VPDAIFAHPRLAPLYDLFDEDRADLAAYLDIADELGAHRVLDVGCGTGCLAIRLAERGREVVGVDPAEASLAVARSKDPSGRITWVHGEIGAVGACGADLAVMTGNVAHVFLTGGDWAQVLRGVHAALRPEGHLVFETRRPERRAWEDWAAGLADVTVEVPGIGPVRKHFEVTEVPRPRRDRNKPGGGRVSGPGRSRGAGPPRPGVRVDRETHELIFTVDNEITRPGQVCGRGWSGSAPACLLMQQIGHFSRSAGQYKSLPGCGPVACRPSC
jgi:SAM-dependent methyltransferase